MSAAHHTPSAVSPHCVRQPLTPTMRYQTYGPLRPMDSDLSWWERLLKR